MKPSERIEEILKNNKIQGGRYDLEAVIQYLDEQYLKKHNHPTGFKCSEC